MADYGLIPCRYYKGTQFQYLDTIPQYNSLGESNYLINPITGEPIMFRTFEAAANYAVTLAEPAYVVEEDNYAGLCIVIDIVRGCSIAEKYSHIS